MENKLDKINQDLKTSQRHLTSIKSVFGGIKNWWKGTPKEETPPPERESRRPAGGLATSMEASSSATAAESSTDHPGLRNTRGLYGDDSGRTQKQQQGDMSDERRQYEARLEQNLGKIVCHISTLSFI